MNIPVSGGNQPPAYLKWDGENKIVETNNGQRVDVYHGGAGKPDGPGHTHSYVLFNGQGEAVEYGADGRW